MIIFLDYLLSVKGHQYTGQVNQSRSNGACQRWDSDVPWSHGHTDLTSYPDDVTSLSDIGNYCRNPDNDPTIWCYKVENGRFDFCDAPKCTGMCDEILTFIV